MRRFFLTVLCFATLVLITSPLTAEDTIVKGTVFANWTLDLNDQGVGKNFNTFNISRGYLTMIHKFSDRYSARITADLFQGNEGWEYRLKYAYVQINGLIPHVDMKFGQIPVFWTGLINSKYWKLRFIETASLQRAKMEDSADKGVSFVASLPSGYAQLALQILNGEGFTESEMNKNKDLAVTAVLYPLASNPDFKQTMLIGQYYKGWPNVEDPSSILSFSSETKKNRISAGAALAYKQWFVAFFDYWTAKDDSDPLNIEETTLDGAIIPEEDESKGMSIFTRINISTTQESFLSKVFIFSKYHWIDNHTNYSGTQLNLKADENDARYITVGVGYTPVKGFTFALTIKRTTENRIETNELGEDIRIAETEKNSLDLNFLGTF